MKTVAIISTRASSLSSEESPGSRKSMDGQRIALSGRLYQPWCIHKEPLLSCAESCDAATEHVIHRRQRDGDEDDPEIHYWTIASANQLIKYALLRDQFSKEHGFLRFGMEAAALMIDFLCLVVRGICDYSDTHKNKQWRGHASITAAAYTKDLLRRVSPSRVNAEETLAMAVSAR
ncbi:hypothetical protein MPH_10306 [Macrophomina phaseolina MS6]|uniref:Uncharacterized protein n=1 Tax=Macrophomina phaseolina (strain MS6) TaxID=1126212 RepID=K2QRT3_MACPH|nr:hypothetical protein MPH_10306 [Macrophomina phaseolina MS6]